LRGSIKIKTMTPKLYSRTAILLFSLLLPFISIILFAQNLRAIGKRKAALLLFVLFVLLPSISALSFFKISADTSDTIFWLRIILPFAFNISLGLLLIFPLWNYFFKEIPEYEIKPVNWMLMLAVFLGICIFFYALQKLNNGF
jgi:hypothetical protein